MWIHPYMTPDQSYKAYLCEYILIWHETMSNGYILSGENLLMQNVIATLPNIVCSQSQLNTAFRSFHAIKVGGLEAQCSQGEPNSIPKLLSATHRVNKSHTGKAGDMWHSCLMVTSQAFEKAAWYGGVRWLSVIECNCVFYACLGKVDLWFDLARTIFQQCTGALSPLTTAWLEPGLCPG